MLDRVRLDQMAALAPMPPCTSWLRLRVVSSPTVACSASGTQSPALTDVTACRGIGRHLRLSPSRQSGLLAELGRVNKADGSGPTPGMVIRSRAGPPAR